jgi:flagellar biogenesis protein FliO
MNPVTRAEQLQPAAGASLVPSLKDASRTLLIKLWNGASWIIRRARAQQSRKNLKVCENVSLGEKRFVAIIQVDEERFLIGGASGSVSLLTRLAEAKSFATDLERAAEKIS